MRGYRINFFSLKQLLRSMCMMHNETINIWTHFLGFLGFSVLLFAFIDIFTLQQTKANILGDTIYAKATRGGGYEA
jgi:predicted membrane channel-forming protein YqfA (hemolysin III family)